MHYLIIQYDLEFFSIEESSCLFYFIYLFFHVFLPRILHSVCNC